MEDNSDSDHKQSKHLQWKLTSGLARVTASARTPRARLRLGSWVVLPSQTRITLFDLLRFDIGVRVKRAVGHVSLGGAAGLENIIHALHRRDVLRLEGDTIDIVP